VYTFTPFHLAPLVYPYLLLLWFWARDKEPRSAAVPSDRNTHTHTHTHTHTDKRTCGGSYLGPIWRRCPCPAGSCANTRGETESQGHRFLVSRTKTQRVVQTWQRMHVNTQTIYVLRLASWVGTIPSRSVYSHSVKLLFEVWEYTPKRYLKFWMYHHEELRRLNSHSEDEEVFFFPFNLTPEEKLSYMSNQTLYLWLFTFF